MRFRIAFLTIVLHVFIHQTQAQQNFPLCSKNLEGQNLWADSVLAQLSLDEKIGQLFMVAAFSNKDSAHVNEITRLVKHYRIGGLCFFQGGPLRQAKLTNYYQSIAKVPLMISIDGEWGLAMRLDSTIRFPRQMTLGAIKDEQMIYGMGAEIARQCKRIGIHINLAPVVDVNNNPLNPVILNRSFGENKLDVARKSLLYMQGMQDNGVMANAKHFPGHGDTDADSHKTLPIVNKTIGHLDSLELYPFKALINKGLGSMMVAHLYIPAYDTTANTASTLSRKVVTDLLQTQLCFNGLIFTDALNMKGVTSYFQPGQVDVKAILAGNDVLLYTENVPKAIEEIKKAIENKQLTSDELNYHVKKILLAKYWMGLNNYQPIVTAHLYEDLNTPAAKLLNQQLFEASATLLNNKNNLLPLKNLETKRIASVVIGDSIGVSFNKMLDNYAPIKDFQLKKDAKPNTVDSLVNELLPSYNTVIVSIHNTSINAAKNYGITETMNSFIEDLQGKCKLIVVVFGNPYVLSKLPAAKNADALLMSYEGAEESQRVAAQSIFGGMSTAGKLPVTANDLLKIRAGISTSAPIRFKYTYSEETGIASSDLSPIDSIVQKAIKAGATPGCQVLVAKDGKVIYNKAFGYHTYDKSLPVKTTDIYDIASITKVAATTISLMQLYDKGQLNLDAKLVKYLPDVKKTNKKNIVLRDMLAHQAGLLSYIKFWQTTMTNDGNWSAAYYRNKPENGFSMQVADSLYIRNDYADSIWARIKKSPLGDTKKYVYSDLGFITAKKIVEKLTHESIDKYTYEHLYRPLGLATMGYLPLNRFDEKRIIPTENDTKFRKQLVWGYVHDPATAMMGGISGHAGVFSNANDLAVLMQMLLNGGEYGGRRYLKESTITTFTSQQFPKNGNRRGLGFDKPEPDTTKSSPTYKGVSLSAFGHQGFTGTCVWVDPKYNLIYVFLSNRVNPNAENDILVKMNVRTDIQKTIYDALKKSTQYGL